MSQRPAVLIGDIGGTNGRFALVGEAGIQPLERLRVADFADAAAALGRVREGAETPVGQALLAVAGPVRGAEARLTNGTWTFHADALAAALGLARVELVNDFAAQALALPELAADDLVPLGGPAEAPAPEAPLAVLGPGTGLGVAALLADGTPLVGEGGHVTLPAASEAEAAVLARLRARYGHVSAERVLSGAGLAALYELHGGGPATAATVTAAARRGERAAAEALEAFFGFLGTVAGDVALTFGARGGVYLTGGILPRLVPELLASTLYARFLAKGRLRGYLEAVPLRLVVHPDAAFLGLARRARELGGL